MSFYLSKILLKPNSFQLRSIRFCAAEGESRYTRDEKGKQPKIIHGQEYPSWRRSMSDTPGEFYSRFKLFDSDKNRAPMLFKLVHYPMLSWPYRIKKWYYRSLDEAHVKSQQFNPSRLQVLGYDLAVTHFVCFRGGGVRFVGGDKWIRCDTIDKKKILQNVPNVYTPGLFVEMIDCENFEGKGLLYEGLENFMFLEQLKWLSLKNNSSIDDWCLDRLTSITTSLEYLDLRGCSVTHRGIQALHRIDNLKLLVLDLEPDEKLEHVCSLLQEFMPDLLIKFCEPEVASKQT